MAQDIPVSGTGGIRTPGPCEPPAFRAGAFVRSATVPAFEASDVRSVASRSVTEPGDTLRAPRERCQSGRMGRPAKALTIVRWSVGSNPTLSASRERVALATVAPTLDECI